MISRKIVQSLLVLVTAYELVAGAALPFEVNGAIDSVVPSVSTFPFPFAFAALSRVALSFRLSLEGSKYAIFKVTKK